MYSPPQRDDLSPTPASPTLSSPPNSALARDTNTTESSALESSELSAALQLLVERAHYITGATGAALALPHNSEMVCRASTGSCAPAIGARLQVRSGLTGESIASRRLLRCDNAESDPRVNLEVCRALGIASIVVLPLLRNNDKDGEVCGLFELLSDHPYAFEERDLVALERMADLALTALDLATQPGQPKEDATRAQSDYMLTDRKQPGRTENGTMPSWPTGKSASPALEWSPASNPLPSPRISRSPDLQSPALQLTGLESPALQSPDILPHDFQANDSQRNDFQHTDFPIADLRTNENPVTSSLPVVMGATNVSPTATGVAPATSPIPALPAPVSTAPSAVPASVPAECAGPALLPETMRLAQKCSACGFPISQGRTLCLDCEQTARSKNVQNQNFQSEAPLTLDVHKQDVHKQDIHNQDARGKNVLSNVVQSNNALSNELLSLARNHPPAPISDSSPSPSDRLSDLPSSLPSDLPSDLASNLRSDLPSNEVLPPFLANAEPFNESWFSNHISHLLAIAVVLIGAFVLYVVLH